MRQLSHVSAIERHRPERPQIDAFQAAYVNGDGGRAVRHRAAGERLHAAAAAEQVLDDLLVELVRRQVLLAGMQRELAGRYEGEQEALALAVRAIAFDHRSEERRVGT